jgi:hypothetical protein
MYRVASQATPRSLADVPEAEEGSTSTSPTGPPADPCSEIVADVLSVSDDELVRQQHEVTNADLQRKLRQVRMATAALGVVGRRGHGEIKRGGWGNGGAGRWGLREIK